jgi:hypothetical protein
MHSYSQVLVTTRWNITKVYLQEESCTYIKNVNVGLDITSVVCEFMFVNGECWYYVWWFLILSVVTHTVFVFRFVCLHSHTWGVCRSLVFALTHIYDIVLDTLYIGILVQYCGFWALKPILSHLVQGLNLMVS